jgi:hypothetical protein
LRLLAGEILLELAAQLREIHTYSTVNDAVSTTGSSASAAAAPRRTAARNPARNSSIPNGLVT